MQKAKEVIDGLREAESDDDEFAPFLKAGGTVDPGAIALLAEAIRKSEEPVRERYVRLLAAVGLEADPLREKGGNLVRDPSVVSLLVSPSLDLPGGGRDFALDTLEASVPPELLRPHHEAIVKDLKAHPGTSAFHLAAKAKSKDAKPVLEALFAMPEWKGNESAAVAMAALGDRELEAGFVDAFIGAQAPKEKIRLARVLGRIATPAALAALAGEMRTEIVYEMPRVKRRSVRLDILEALSRNFPEKTFLWDNALSNDEGYARVEAFCESEFKITWKKPRPPYLKIQGFPSEPDE